MQIIEQLQRSRPEVVHLFDELVATLPEGVYLTQLSQSEASVQVKGMAQSNARVSSYMRNIEASVWLASPKLDVIETKEAAEQSRMRVSNFTLELKQARPDSDESKKDGRS